MCDCYELLAGLCFQNICGMFITFGVAFVYVYGGFLYPGSD